ncbi:hypothetical protein PGB90_002974 [Kerria lacca]
MLGVELRLGGDAESIIRIAITYLKLKFCEKFVAVTVRWGGRWCVRFEGGFVRTKTQTMCTRDGSPLNEIYCVDLLNRFPNPTKASNDK